MRFVMKRFFIVQSFLFCMFSSYLLDAYIQVLPAETNWGGNVGAAFGSGLDDGMHAVVQENMRASEREQEYQYYLAKLRAQEEMMERERQREQAHQQYLAELELERIRQAEQFLEKDERVK